MNKKILFIALIASALFVSSVALASFEGEQNSYYVFHLLYDHGKITADKSFKYAYDIIPGDIGRPPSASGIYWLEIYSMAGKSVYKEYFDPQGGNPGALTAKITLDEPYFPDAKEIKFFDNSGIIIYKIDLSETSFCNDNGKCEIETGETHGYCPLDCAPGMGPTPSGENPSGEPEPTIVPSSTPTPSAVPSPSGVPVTPTPETPDETPGNTTSILNTLLFIGVILGLVVVIILLIRLKHKQSAG